MKERLEYWVKRRNDTIELSQNASADPLSVAKRYKDEYIALICALFAYGNAKQIVKFLNSLDFSLLDDEEKNYQNSHEKIYRFQSSQDIKQIFLTISRVKKLSSLEDIFCESYKKKHSVLDGIYHLIEFLYDINPYRSFGYEFLLGKINSNSPLKRWNMYLRWMVRKDELDLGLWKKVKKSDLLAPLDTHTHKMALKYGLIKRKSYDLKACLELSQTYKNFDPKDPIKYDFAIYRLGQEKIEL